MKKLIAIVSVTLLVSWTISIAQSPLHSVKEKISDPDLLENWKLGELKAFGNVSILRMEGENSFDNRTNMLYTSSQNILRLVACKAEQENLSEGEKIELMKSYFKEAPGGQLTLFFNRAEKRLADPTLFTVEVIDAYSGETVYRKVLENEEPSYYKWGIWYFQKTLNVPYLLEREFVVKVKDSGLNKVFKFHVTVDENKEENPFQPEFMLSQAPLPL